VKFDHVAPDDEGGPPASGARFQEEDRAPATEPSAPLHLLMLQRSSEYMRLRSRADFARVRPALNRLLHTVEVARAEAAPGPEPDAADAAEVFRPESFRARTRPRPAPPATSDQ